MRVWVCVCLRESERARERDRERDRLCKIDTAFLENMRATVFSWEMSTNSAKEAGKRKQR